ncbi:MAG TPA: hypothetical protein VNU19_01035 [Candidatus Acidoferrum sp.]|nr:hypothetical protein [Candidatus Acidoferrum sp.]
MRSTCLVLFVAGLVAACGMTETSQVPTPARAAVACTTGYSAQSPVINLSVTDSGRSITAHLCDAIWIVLAGSPPQPWLFVQSSDPTVLAVVPLPLAHPPNGTEAVYLARKIGAAELSSTTAIPPCTPIATCPPPAQWSVAVTVLK